MTVIIAENTPDKVRGLLKRWFLEPKPNVFVGTVNRRTREKVLQYLLRYSPEDLAMLVIFDDDNSQGFSIHRYGDASRCDRLVSGHYLLAVSAEDFSSRDKELGGVFGEVLAECFISYRQKS